MTVDIKDFLRKLKEMHTVIEIRHSDKVNTWRSMDDCKENAVRHFGNVLERRKKRPLCGS